MRRVRPGLLSFALVLASSFALSGPSLASPPNVDRSFPNPNAARAALPVSQGLQSLTSRVAHTDARTGAPSFVWGMLDAPHGAAGVSSEEAALMHLRKHAALYGLSSAALASATEQRVHDTGRGGIMVTLQQRLSGIPVVGVKASVLMRRDHSLVAISGNLRADAVEAQSRESFKLTAEQAIALTLSAHRGLSLSAQDFEAVPGGSKGDYQSYALASGQTASGLRLSRPVRVRQVYYPTPRKLVPAYYVEAFSASPGAAEDVYSFHLSAVDGTLLGRRNLTSDIAFKYRVFADAAGDNRPLDGPIADFTPHPTGVPDGSYPPFVASTLIEIDGFNEFADPWLAADAVDSRGNNVDAYTDHDDSNSSAGGDVRATLTGPLEFDHNYDPTLGPLDSQEQQEAAVTQLFFTTNWLHDYWYDSGFNEAAGNAQLDNYGRGGEGSDRLRCEAQDAFDNGALNNANMATPADGSGPRMQMFVWRGTESRSLTVDTLAQTLETNRASFGPQQFDVSAEVILVNDGTASTSNACETIQNDLTGRIALIDRGDCSFEDKAVRAEAAGAVGVLIVNNQAGSPPFMPPSDGVAVAIPLLSISLADGNALKTSLMNGPTTAQLQRSSGPLADGTIDNLVVAHEWGHYLHHRLVDCGLNQCGGESEGWADFIALMLAVREGDDLDGAFSSAVYATVSDENAAYFGTRRFPYSRDPSKNPLTFKHIQNSAELPMTAPGSLTGVPNAEVHATGEVWASMLFDGYLNLLAESAKPNPRYDFEEARRRMADYVVAGMQLAPIEPTFTEQRDALIAAAYAADPADALIIAEGFAGRGAGSCAESPPNDSFTNEGVVESFEVAPAVTIVEVALDDTGETCDSDGALDVGEGGKITVTLANRGYLPALATKVTLSSDSTGVSFPGGAETVVETLEGFATLQLEFAVTVTGDSAPRFLDLVTTVENPSSCNPMVLNTAHPRISFDTTLMASATDDFESDKEQWKRDGDASELIWSRDTEEGGNRLWHGLDYSSVSDTALVSPPLTVKSDEPLTMSFNHRYRFEASLQDPNDLGSLIYWDGGVIELSKDDGDTWEDVADYAAPEYTATLGNLSGNPLSDREAFAGESLNWPELVPVTLDFGTALAGQTVQFRFRIGSDQAASELGWEFDDVGFSGIVETPFPSLIPDAQSCNVVDTGGGGAGGEAGSGAGGSNLDSGISPNGGGCSCDTAASSERPALAWLLAASALIGVRRSRRARKSS